MPINAFREVSRDNSFLLALLAFVVGCALPPTPAPAPDLPPKDLAEAIDRLDATAVQLLIAEGADVNATVGTGKHPTGDTPLALAVWKANETSPDPAACRIMKLLIKAGADVNTLNRDGRNLLHYPHNPEAVGLLLEAGASVDLRAPDDGTTPLYRTDNVEIIRLLVPAAGDLDSIDSHGMTAVDYHLQWSFSRREVLALLRDAGALRAAEIANECLAEAGADTGSGEFWASVRKIGPAMSDADVREVLGPPSMISRASDVFGWAIGEMPFAFPVWIYSRGLVYGQYFSHDRDWSTVNPHSVENTSHAEAATMPEPETPHAVMVVLTPKGKVRNVVVRIGFASSELLREHVGRRIRRLSGDDLMGVYLRQAEVCSVTDYADPRSVQAHNAAVDTMYATVEEAERAGPDRVSKLASCLDDKTTGPWLAHHLVEKATIPDAVRQKCFAIVERRAEGDGAKAAGERAWLLKWRDGG